VRHKVDLLCFFPLKKAQFAARIADVYNEIQIEKIKSCSLEEISTFAALQLLSKRKVHKAKVR